MIRFIFTTLTSVTLLLILSGCGGDISIRSDLDGEWVREPSVWDTLEATEYSPAYQVIETCKIEVSTDRVVVTRRLSREYETPVEVGEPDSVEVETYVVTALEEDRWVLIEKGAEEEARKRFEDGSSEEIDQYLLEYKTCYLRVLDNDTLLWEAEGWEAEEGEYKRP